MFSGTKKETLGALIQSRISLGKNTGSVGANIVGVAIQTLSSDPLKTENNV